MGGRKCEIGGGKEHAEWGRYSELETKQIDGEDGTLGEHRERALGLCASELIHEARV